MPFEGRDQVVVITGGSAGIGRATAREFAVAGAKIAVLARGRDGLAATTFVAGVAALTMLLRTRS